jgi:hypothetical protein
MDRALSTRSCTGKTYAGATFPRDLTGQQHNETPRDEAVDTRYIKEI